MTKREDTPTKKVKTMRLVQPYSADINNIFDLICGVYAVSKEDLIPNLDPQDCM